MHKIHMKIEYFGGCWFAFSIICALDNANKNEIFRQLLAPKSREILFVAGGGWFPFGISCALNTCKNEIFQQLSALKDFGEYCLWLREHLH